MISKLENILKNCIIKPIKLATLAASLYLTNSVYSADVNIPKDYQKIQAGIDAAVNGDSVIVAPGVYNELVDFKGKAITLKSSDGAERTIIDGFGFNDSVVKCVNGETLDTILEGFTITGGGVGRFFPNNMVGGGMFNYQSSPTIINCIFKDNLMSDSSSAGGGMFNANSSPTIMNSLFIRNVATHSGAMQNFESNIHLINCVFSHNYSGHSAGGIYNHDSSCDMQNCIFNDNFASNGQGGAIF